MSCNDHFQNIQSTAKWVPGPTGVPAVNPVALANLNGLAKSFAKPSVVAENALRC